MAKKTLTGPGLEPVTSVTYQRSSHLSYPALWMVAVPNSQIVFALYYALLYIYIINSQLVYALYYAMLYII